MTPAYAQATFAGKFRAPEPRFATMGLMDLFGHNVDRKPFWDRDSWEPEPLELPIEPPDIQRDRPETEGDESEDLPGSHVIVIDMA